MTAAADMAAMAVAPSTREWWQHCRPCQVLLPDRQAGEWWAAAQEVFHLD